MLVLHEKLEFLMPGENFPLKKGNFLPMGQKDSDFLCCSTLEPLVTFLGLKITHLVKMRFFDSPGNWCPSHKLLKSQHIFIRSDFWENLSI